MSTCHGDPAFHLNSQSNGAFIYEDSTDGDERVAARRVSLAISTASMTGTLIAGIALAIGHDRFYGGLDGKEISVAYPNQQWVNRIGTGLAFSVKMFLVMTVTSAYVQRLWRNVKTRSFRVKSVDQFMAAPSNITSLLDLHSFWVVPELFLLALLIWCLPLAAIVTPGTLIVTNEPTSSERHIQVPQLSFNGEDWGTLQAEDTRFAYGSATAPVLRAAYGSAVSGVILDVPHDFKNMSYHLDFEGPALQCFNANDTVYYTVSSMLRGSIGSGGLTRYVSWTGRDDHGWLSNSTFDSGSSYWQTIDQESDDTARIFFASLTSESDCGYSTCYSAIECDLYHASYSANFNFTNDQTVVSISSSTINGMLPFLSNPNWTVPDVSNQSVSIHVASQSIMDAFGKLLVGSATQSGSQVATTTVTSFPLTHILWDNSENMKRGLEELFLNMTLSMFSDTALSQNSSQAAYLPVVVTTYPILYAYEAMNLRIAYGVSVGISLLAVTIGLYSLHQNEASYSGNFSTIVRVTKTTGLLHAVDGTDDGSDPLPKSMVSLKLRAVKSGRLLGRAN